MKFDFTHFRVKEQGEWSAHGKKRRLHNHDFCLLFFKIKMHVFDVFFWEKKRYTFDVKAVIVSHRQSIFS